MAKTLIIRLSSLGDVVMASSSLEVPRIREAKADWVILPAFSPLIQGHPNLNRVWEFDRKSGLKGWVVLARKLWEERYDEVLDLHLSLRSFVLRYFFFCWSLGERRKYRWRSASKQRLRFFSLYLLKRFQPGFLRPERMVQKFARVAGGDGSERPNLKHLLSCEPTPAFREVLAQIKSPYLCVMPSSRWAAKKWPVERFVELLKSVSELPVILGAPEDRESYELVQKLKEAGVAHLSAVGRWSLPEVARVLAGSKGYLGCDTGLGHLAEAVGVKSTVIFGPTVPEMGFGPWRAESRTIGKEMWCRPCGKDGRYCYRPSNKFKCMTALGAEEVREQALK